MTTFENLVNSLTLENVQCIICGSEHDYTDCSFIRIQCYVIDNAIPTKARLTLPGFLQVQVLADGTNSIITNETIMSGTCFGPVEGVKSSALHPQTLFPLKIFNTGADSSEEYYIESLDENKCNWMMFIPPADDREEQNLICFQEGDNIYFVAMREIQAGELLKVWYGPFYANKMNTDLLSVVRQEKDNVDVNVLVKRQQKIMERKSWICKYCGKVETFVTTFAKHMIEHYKNKRKCVFCNETFRTAQGVKQHIKAFHPNELTEGQRKLLDIKDEASKKNSANNLDLGGPLLNEMLSLSDSLDTSMDFHQSALNSLTSDDILLESENTNLNVDNLINDNVNELDHFNFEIGESQDQLICDICLNEFNKMYSLVEHLRQHTGEFLCNQCLKVFSRKENLTTHICNRTSELDCTFCEKTFTQKKYLRRHIVVVHQNTFRCEKCNKSYSSQNELSKHNCPSVPPSEPQQTFSCTKCSKVFQKNKSLNQHMKTHISESTQEETSTMAICNDCGEVFTNRKSYYQHLTLHKESRFQCEICDRKFHKNSSLKEHMKVHSDAEPVTCDICNKELKNNRRLQIHKRQHMLTEKLKCPSCDQTFTTAESRRRHLKRVHNENKKEDNDDTKMYKCPLCPARTKFRSSIMRHIKQKHPDAKADVDFTLIEKIKFKNVLNEIKHMKPCHNVGEDTIQIEDNTDKTNALVPDLPNLTEEVQMADANEEIPFHVIEKADHLNSINEEIPVRVTTNQSNIAEFSAEKNITNNGLDDLEFETILNEPNQENYERYFSFDDIDSNDAGHNYTGFGNNTNEQGSETTQPPTVDNNAFILENGNLAQGQQPNPNNIVVYIIKQNDNTLG